MAVVEDVVPGRAGRRTPAATLACSGLVAKIADRYCVTDVGALTVELRSGRGPPRRRSARSRRKLICAGVERDRPTDSAWPVVAAAHHLVARRLGLSTGVAGHRARRHHRRAGRRPARPRSTRRRGPRPPSAALARSTRRRAGGGTTRPSGGHRVGHRLGRRRRLAQRVDRTRATDSAATARRASSASDRRRSRHVGRTSPRASVRLRAHRDLLASAGGDGVHRRSGSMCDAPA